MISAALTPFAVDNRELLARKSAIEKTCEEVGIPVEKSKMAGEYANIIKTLASPRDISSLETEAYSHLYNFFSAITKKEICNRSRLLDLIYENRGRPLTKICG
jgi:hypothetical protein